MTAQPDYALTIAAHPASPRNPYQSLLHEALEAIGDSTRQIDAYPLSSINPYGTMARLRADQVDAIHLHWPVFGPRWEFPGTRHVRLVVALCWLNALKRSGLPLIWTVHNVQPHEPRTSADALVYRRLSRLADAKIVHSSQTTQDMAAIGLDTRRTFVVPHGNYRAAYPSPTDKTTARKHLGWPDVPTVVFVGGVSKYKGLDTLLSGFKALRSPGARLVIAGDCLDPDLDRELRRAADGGRAITYENTVLTDDMLVRYVSASDVVCLPFRRVTTSGSALLAISLGRPIVAPLIGSLRDLPRDLGYFYDPADADGFRQALFDAVVTSDGYPKGFHAALESFLTDSSWDRIAQATHEVYHSALRHRSAG